MFIFGVWLMVIIQCRMEDSENNGWNQHQHLEKIAFLKRERVLGGRKKIGKHHSISATLSTE